MVQQVQSEPDFQFYAHPPRDSEYRELAGEVIRHAFHDLNYAESWVARNRRRLEALPPLHADRNRGQKKFYYLALPIIEQVRSDLAFTRSSRWELWSYFVDLDPEMMATQYQGRAGRLLRLVDEITRGGV